MPLIAILDRYILRELMLTQMAVIVVLTLTIVGNFFARLLSYAVEGRFHADILMPLVGLISLHALIKTLPVAVFLSVMLVLGRLYKDSEMPAMRGAGVGYLRLYRPLLLFALPMIALSTYLSLVVGPWSAGMVDQVRHAASNRSELVGITPGRFIQAQDGKRVFFVESIDNEQMRNVFVFVRRDDTSYVVTAERAAQAHDSATQQRYIVLADGYRYEGVPGEAEFRMMNYATHGVLVPNPAAGGVAVKRDAESSWRLWQSGDIKDQAELQWRLSFPISVLLLVLIAQPLAHTTPRQGRFGKLIVAVAVYVIYANAVVVGRSAIEQGQVPAWLGIWGVHAAFAATGLLLLGREFGRRWLTRPLIWPWRVHAEGV